MQRRNLLYDADGEKVLIFAPNTDGAALQEALEGLPAS